MAETTGEQPDGIIYDRFEGFVFNEFRKSQNVAERDCVVVVHGPSLCAA